MKYRIYISKMGDIATGYIDDETLSEIEKYQSFFQENDVHGEGFFEAELPTISDTEPVFVRAGSEDMSFGVYDPEGWYPIHGSETVQKNDCEVVFDSMIPYYAYEDLVADEYDGYLGKEQIYKVLHTEDKEVFDKVFQDYKSDQNEG